MRAPGRRAPPEGSRTAGPGQRARRDPIGAAREKREQVTGARDAPRWSGDGRTRTSPTALPRQAARPGARAAAAPRPCPCGPRRWPTSAACRTRGQLQAVVSAVREGSTVALQGDKVGEPSAVRCKTRQAGGARRGSVAAASCLRGCWLHQRPVAGRAALAAWCDTHRLILAAEVGVRALVQEQGRHLQVPVSHGQVQRRVARLRPQQRAQRALPRGVALGTPARQPSWRQSESTRALPGPCQPHAVQHVPW